MGRQWWFKWKCTVSSLLILFVCLSVLTYVANSYGRFLDKKLFIYGKSLIPLGLFVFYCLGLPTFLIRSLSFKLLNVKSGRWREKRHRRLWNIGDKAISQSLLVATRPQWEFFRILKNDKTVVISPIWYGKRYPEALLGYEIIFLSSLYFNLCVWSIWPCAFIDSNCLGNHQIIHVASTSLHFISNAYRKNNLCYTEW